MRKVRLQIQCSLDGFIEGQNGEMDWISRDSEDQWADLFEDLKSVDTLLLGHGMYPEYANYWRGVLKNPSASKNEIAYAKLAEKTPHIVFSKTETRTDWKNTRFMKDPKEIIKLKQQPGKDMILWGGSRMVSSFMNLGLIDEYKILVNPMVLGGGKPLFANQEQRKKLTLVGAKTYQSGVVMLHYRSV
jgi:dihydrofolate reductase